MRSTILLAFAIVLVVAQTALSQNSMSTGGSATPEPTSKDGHDIPPSLATKDADHDHAAHGDHEHHGEPPSAEPNAGEAGTNSTAKAQASPTDSKTGGNSASLAIASNVVLGAILLMHVVA